MWELGGLVQGWGESLESPLLAQTGTQIMTAINGYAEKSHNMMTEVTPSPGHLHHHQHRPLLSSFTGTR